MLKTSALGPSSRQEGSGHSFRLDGRRALVTGASRGIGRSIAIGLAGEGADVLVHFHRDAEAADAVVGSIRRDGGSAAQVQADLTEADGGQRLGEAALAGGAIDILVLNAGIQERRPLAAVDRALLEAHVNANLWSAIQLLQLVLPGMKERQWGRILGLGSVQQVRPNPNLLIYAGLKSALSTILQSLAKAHARDGITANVLAPGLIDTDRNTELKADPGLYQALLERIPTGAAGEAEDCVGAALLLCSDAGRYITGIDLLVDGGLHLP